MGSPRISTHPTRSQATPFAEDFLNLLRTGMRGGGLEGFDPFGFGSGTRDVSSPDDLITSLTDVHRRELGRSSADLTESFGAQGARFGSTIGRAQTDLHRESGEDLARIMAELEMNLNQLGIMRDLQVGQQRLGGLGFLGNMASTGIHPDQTVVKDNPFMQLMQIGAPIFAAAMGNPALAAALFGGGQAAGGQGGGGAQILNPMLGTGA